MADNLAPGLVLFAALGLFYAILNHPGRDYVYDVSCVVPEMEIKDVRVGAWSGPMTLRTSDNREIVVTNSTQCVFERKTDADKDH